MHVERVNQTTTIYRVEPNKPVKIVTKKEIPIISEKDIRETETEE